MAFRYVKADDGKPVMPKVRSRSYRSLVLLSYTNILQGMLELIGKDAEKDIMDLLPEDDG